MLCHAGGQQLGKRSEGDGAAFHSHQSERGSRATEGSSLRGRVAELATSRRRGVEREEPSQHPREEASNHRLTIRCAGSGGCGKDESSNVDHRTFPSPSTSSSSHKQKKSVEPCALKAPYRRCRRCEPSGRSQGCCGPWRPRRSTSRRSGSSSPPPRMATSSAPTTLSSTSTATSLGSTS